MGSALKGIHSRSEIVGVDHAPGHHAFDYHCVSDQIVQLIRISEPPAHSVSRTQQRAARTHLDAAGQSARTRGLAHGVTS